MNTLLAIFSFILGSIMASFGGVIVFRVPNNLSIVKPDSFCPNCKNSIKWYDNIPILSYILLKGKCRYCGSKIGLFSLIFEILGGLSFLLVFLKFKISILALVGFAIAFLLLVMAGIDYQTHYIYDFSQIIFLVLSLLYLFVSKSYLDYVNHLIGALIGFGFFFLIRVIGGKILKQECLGMGDVILMGIGGLLLGPFSLLFSLLIGSVLGSIIELTLMKLNKKTREDEIAFGPYLILGIFVAFLYGSNIISWYLGMVI